MERKKRAAAIVGGTFVAVIVVFGWAAMRPSCGATGNEHVPDWVADAGYTLDPKVLSQYMSVPRSENAAPLLFALGEEFYNNTELKEAVSSRDSVSACRDYDVANPALYKRLKDAASLSTCDFERDWDDYMVAKFPEFGAVTNGARYLSALAQEDARIGDYEKALERLTVLDRLAGHLRSESWSALVSQFGARRIMFSAVGSIVAAHPTDARSHKLINDVLEMSRSKPNLKLAYQGQLMTLIHGVRRYNLDDLGTDWFGTVERGPLKKLPSPKFLQEVEDILMTALEQEYAAMNLPTWPERIAESERLINNWLSDSSAPVEYIGILLPMNDVMYRNAAQDESTVELLRLLHYVLTTDIVILLPDTAIDPATQEMFRMSRADGSLKIYSLGFDGIDDGGPNRIGYDPGNTFTQGYDFGFWIDVTDE